jgi:hypothetical protein
MIAIIDGITMISNSSHTVKGLLEVLQFFEADWRRCAAGSSWTEATFDNDFVELYLKGPPHYVVLST